MAIEKRRGGTIHNEEITSDFGQNHSYDIVRFGNRIFYHLYWNCGECKPACFISVKVQWRPIISSFHGSLSELIYFDRVFFSSLFFCCWTIWYSGESVTFRVRESLIIFAKCQPDMCKMSIILRWLIVYETAYFNTTPHLSTHTLIWQM